MNRKIKEIIPLFLRASDLVLPSASKYFIKVRRRNFKSFSFSFYVSPDYFIPNQVLSVNIKSFSVLKFLNLLKKVLEVGTFEDFYSDSL